jgi:hypothetical protein
MKYIRLLRTATVAYVLVFDTLLLEKILGAVKILTAYNRETSSV